MNFLNNSFPDHEIEVKLAVPEVLGLAELADKIAYQIESLSLNLRRITDVRTHEHIYHYFQTPDGKKVAKIVESNPNEHKAKRKWNYPSADIPRIKGLVIKREEKSPALSTYEEALVQVQAWARDSAVEICAGPQLAIMKVKTLVQDLNNGRIAQIILDEARDLDHPRVKTLRQIEIEYKGQAQAEPTDDFKLVADSMLAISQRIKGLHPEFKHTQRSKFKHFSRG